MMATQWFLKQYRQNVRKTRGKTMSAHENHTMSTPVLQLRKQVVHDGTRIWVKGGGRSVPLAAPSTDVGLDGLTHELLDLQDVHSTGVHVLHFLLHTTTPHYIQFHHTTSTLPSQARNTANRMTRITRMNGSQTSLWRWHAVAKERSPHV